MLPNPSHIGTCHTLLTLGKKGADMKQLVTFSLSLPSVLGTNTQFSSGEPSSRV